MAAKVALVHVSPEGQRGAGVPFQLQRVAGIFGLRFPLLISALSGEAGHRRDARGASHPRLSLGQEPSDICPRPKRQPSQLSQVSDRRHVGQAATNPFRCGQCLLARQPCHSLPWRCSSRGTGHYERDTCEPAQMWYCTHSTRSGADHYWLCSPATVPRFNRQRCSNGKPVGVRNTKVPKLSPNLLTRGPWCKQLPAPCGRRPKHAVPRVSHRNAVPDDGHKRRRDEHPLRFVR